MTVTDLVGLARTRDPEHIERLLRPEQPLEPLLDAAHRMRLEGL